MKIAAGFWALFGLIFGCSVGTGFGGRGAEGNCLSSSTSITMFSTSLLISVVCVGFWVSSARSTRFFPFFVLLSWIYELISLGLS